MEKRLATLTAIGSFVVLCLFVVFFIIYSESDDTCTSKECVKTSSELLTYLNPSVAPCNDFYEFTCGNFLKAIDENESTVQLTDFMKSAKMNQIRQMIEEPVNIRDGKSLTKTKSFYSACMNETAIDIVGLKGMKGILRDIGGWPLLERGDWREYYFDWKKATYQLRKIGINFTPFFNIDIGINSYDSTKHVITIKKGSLKYINFTTKEMATQYDYMVEVAGYFGADKNRAEHDSLEVVQFQDQLKKVIIQRYTQDIKHSDPHNPKTLTQMQYEFPGIPWVDYINGILYPSATVTSDEVVNVVDPEYIKKFLELLNITPKRILANFISWHVIQLQIAYLPEKMRNIRDKYKDKMEIYTKRSRREVCLNTVKNKMSHSIEASYVKKYISDEAKRITKDVKDYIKKEFNKIIMDLDWMDDDAKEVTRQKLASIKDYIAHTQEVPKYKKIQFSYDEVESDEENFLEFLLNIDLVNLNLKYRKLIEPVYEDEINSLIYSIKENTLVLPSYYLQGLFFNEDRPQYMNFGAIGTIIAYQLSNLFLEGRRYDLYGNLREWSTSQSLLNYDNRAKCISEQYKEFYISGIGKNVNSTFTREDDVATIIGKRIAYQAYRTWAENHDTEHRLPGLSYTPRQLFWISSAIYECWQPTKQDKEIFNPDRSQPKLRVLGPLRNSPEFAKDFSCPTDTYMNPNNKCMLW